MTLVRNVEARRKYRLVLGALAFAKPAAWDLPHRWDARTGARIARGLSCQKDHILCQTCKDSRNAIRAQRMAIGTRTYNITEETSKGKAKRPGHQEIKISFPKSQPTGFHQRYDHR